MIEAAVVVASLELKVAVWRVLPLRVGMTVPAREEMSDATAELSDAMAEVAAV